MFSLICVWINDRVNDREAGDLRRNRAHYDVIVMCVWHDDAPTNIWLDCAPQRVGTSSKAFERADVQHSDDSRQFADLLVLRSAAANHTLSCYTFGSDLADDAKTLSQWAEVLRSRRVRLRSQELLVSSPYLAIMPRRVLAGICKARPAVAPHIPAIVIPMARHLCSTLVFPMPSCSEYW